MDEILKESDKDLNGLIDREEAREYLQVHHRALEGVADSESFESDFSAIDTNGDGFLAPTEIDKNE